MTLGDRIALACLQFASRIAAPERRAWLSAMIAEFHALESRPARFRLVPGAFRFVLVSHLERRGGIARLGQTAIGTGLLVFGGIGAVMASRMPDGVGQAVSSACLVYAIGGLIALHSLRGLGLYARLCGLGVVAALGWVATQRGGAPIFDIYGALLVEALVLMVGLTIAAGVLPQLRWESPDD